MNRINRVSYTLLNGGLLVLIFVLIFYVSNNLNAPNISQQFSKSLPLLILFSFGVSTFFGIKRLHDMGKSGWFMILLYIPLLNALFNLYLMLAPGQKGKNKYGDSPKSGIALF